MVVDVAGHASAATRSGLQDGRRVLMTRRQLARERRAYNRLRRLWTEALRDLPWPLDHDARWEACERMDIRVRARPWSLRRSTPRQAHASWDHVFSRELLASNMAFGARLACGLGEL